jgi:hypothetical protein
LAVGGAGLEEVVHVSSCGWVCLAKIFIVTITLP